LPNRFKFSTYISFFVCCSFAEVSVSLLFILLVFLWFARDPGFVAGYGSLFKKGFVVSLLSVYRYIHFSLIRCFDIYLVMCTD